MSALKTITVRAQKAVAYRHPESGLTWSGRGKTPAWLLAAIQAGGKREDFAVTSAAGIDPEEPSREFAQSAEFPAGELLRLPLDEVIPSPSNPRRRFTEPAMAELTASVLKHGIMQPIIVRPIPPALKVKHPGGRYEICAGERRWMAAGAAGMSTVPALCRELGDLEFLELQTLENLQRENLHPIEEAEGFQRLQQEAGISADQIGERVGKSKAYVYAALKLLALCPAARDLFFGGKLTASTALLVARIPVPALQIKAAQEITEPKYGNGEPLSFRDAKRHVQQHYTLDLKRAPFDIADADLWPSAGACTDCPKRAGNAPDDYQDVDADICTDPECYATKREALAKRIQQEAMQAGKQVITTAQAGDYIYLDNICFSAPYVAGKGYPTYREVLGDACPEAAVVCLDPHTATLTDIAPATAIKNALATLGIKTGVSAARTQEELKAKEDAQKVAKAFRQRLCQEVRVQNSLLLTPCYAAFLETTMEYSEMNVQQRAEYLLAKGVEAKLDIDPEAQAPGYAAHAIGVGKLPCGYHASEQEAIDAGTAWLRAKAMPHNA